MASSDLTASSSSALGPSGSVPLLDKGTHFHQTPGSGVAVEGFGPFKLNLWPTCSEAVLTFVGAGSRVLGDGAAVGEAEGNRERSARRARTAVRRYLAHNSLTEMWTLTYRNEPTLDAVSGDIEQLLRRFQRATGAKPGPYLLVPEWGTEQGRLHVHLAADWRARFGAVAVCERCARAALFESGFEVPASGSLCVGCLWGRGFVAPPSTGGSSSSGLSHYLSKYLAKDFAEVELFGRDRYRAAHGFKPVCESVRVGSFAEAWAIVDRALGTDGALGYWTSEMVEGWTGPQVVMFAPAALEDAFDPESAADVAERLERRVEARRVRLEGRL